MAFAVEGRPASSSNATASSSGNTSGVAVDGIGEILDLAAELTGIADEAEDGQGQPPSAPSAGSSGDPPPTAAKPPPPPPAPQAEPSACGPPIPDGPPGWTMTPKGYVFDADARHMDRITAWGKNVSVKCALHNCSKAKGRHKISDGDLAKWLARGVAECGLGQGKTIEQLRCSHQAMFP